jgi:hypothetical protein
MYTRESGKLFTYFDWVTIRLRGHLRRVPTRAFVDLLPRYAKYASNRAFLTQFRGARKHPRAVRRELSNKKFVDTGFHIGEWLMPVICSTHWWHFYKLATTMSHIEEFRLEHPLPLRFIKGLEQCAEPIKLDDRTRTPCPHLAELASWQFISWTIISNYIRRRKLRHAYNARYVNSPRQREWCL